jgi:putative ABC transport system permease protein
VTRDATLLPVFMTGARALLVLVLALLMCTAAGLLALRKLRRADPAELF